MRDRLIWLGVLLYAVLFTGLGALKYAIHRNLVDFGIFAQTAASAFGCFCNTVEGSHWAYHFSPILYLAGAVVAVAHSPLALIALQSLACALVAPPIAALVRARADVRAARLAALVVWLYPPLAGLAFGDFHENVFAPAAIAWMLWAFDSRRWRLTLLFALLALAVKEDQAIFLAIAGALGAWRFRGTAMGRTALLVAGLGIIVLVGFYRDVQPHAGALVEWSPTRFYAWRAPDVHALFPVGIFARLGFLALAFVPLLFLPFRSRMIWLAAAPLAEVLLSRMPTTFTMGTHYAGAWVGYALVAFAFAVRRIPAPRAQRLLAIAAALCALEFLVADPLHPALNLRGVQPRDVALDRFLATLPPSLDVATQEEAYTHLALWDPHARPLPELPATPLDACFVLIDRDYPHSPRLQEYGGAFDALVRVGRYAILRRHGAIALYASSSSSPQSARCGQPFSSRTMR
ncbi:MAG TPA: DUF2079 domain-containing protein [Candidatus Tyrphobacter sp.]